MRAERFTRSGGHHVLSAGCTLLITLAFIVVPRAAFAQAALGGYALGGYALGGIGAAAGEGRTAALVSGAAGLEGPLQDGLRWGGEVALMAGGGERMMVLSPGLSLRFRPGARVVPFATGGYSFLTSLDGSAHAAHVAGGLELRVRPSRAVRIELRDVVRPSTAAASHLWTLRVGVTFGSRVRARP